jgi:hypothetical protein
MHSGFNVAKALWSLPIHLTREKKTHPLKIAGYLAMDPVTPLVSDYANAIARIENYDLPRAKTDLENRAYCVVDRNLMYVAKTGPWPRLRDSETLGYEMAALAQIMKLEVSDLYQIRTLLKKASDRRDLQEISRMIPQHASPVPEGAYVIRTTISGEDRREEEATDKSQ